MIAATGPTARSERERRGLPVSRRVWWRARRIGRSARGRFATLATLLTLHGGSPPQAASVHRSGFRRQLRTLAGAGSSMPSTRPLSRPRAPQQACESAQGRRFCRWTPEQRHFRDSRSGSQSPDPQRGRLPFSRVRRFWPVIRISAGQICATCRALCLPSRLSMNGERATPAVVLSVGGGRPTGSNGSSEFASRSAGPRIVGAVAQSHGKTDLALRTFLGGFPCALSREAALAALLTLPRSYRRHRPRRPGGTGPRGTGPGGASPGGPGPGGTSPGTRLLAPQRGAHRPGPGHPAIRLHLRTVVRPLVAVHPVGAVAGEPAATIRPAADAPGSVGRVFSSSGRPPRALAERNCRVPAGRALFFPIINNESENTPKPGDAPTTYTPAELAQYSKDGIDVAHDIAAEIDGRSVPGLVQPTRYRAASPPFSVTPVEDNFIQHNGYVAPGGRRIPGRRGRRLPDARAHAAGPAHPALPRQRRSRAGRHLPPVGRVI